MSSAAISASTLPAVLPAGQSAPAANGGGGFAAILAALGGGGATGSGGPLASVPPTGGDAKKRLLDELTAALQSGTSISALADQLAQALAQKLAAELGGTSADAGANTVARLTDIFRKALDPPNGAAPPGGPAAQAAALIGNLQMILQGTVGAAGSNGQQVRTLGAFLDAEAARETPARRMVPPSTSPASASQNTSVAPGGAAEPVAAATVNSSSALAAAITSAAARMNQNLAQHAAFAAKSPPSSAPSVPGTGSSAASTSSVSSDSATGGGDQARVALDSRLIAIASGGNSDAISRSLTRAANVAAATGNFIDEATQQALAGANTLKNALHWRTNVESGLEGNAQSSQAAATMMLPDRFAAPQTNANLIDAAVERLLSGSTPPSSGSASGDGNSSTNGGPLDQKTIGALLDEFIAAARRGPVAKSASPTAPPSIPGFSSATSSTSSSQESLFENSAAASMPAVDPSDVADYIVRGLALRNDGATSEIRLRLIPESLGDISVKLVVQGGSVSATLLTHTAQAHELLSANQQQLARSLAEAGLKLQNFSVNYSGSDSSGTFADRQAQRDQSSGRPSRTSALAEQTPAAQGGLTEAAPPLLSKSLLALNYFA